MTHCSTVHDSCCMIAMECSFCFAENVGGGVVVHVKCMMSSHATHRHWNESSILVRKLVLLGPLQPNIFFHQRTPTHATIDRPSTIFEQRSNKTERMALRSSSTDDSDMVNKLRSQ